MARETQVGPQARIDLRDELHRQVEESVKRGAKRLLGGEIPPGKGAFPNSSAGCVWMSPKIWPPHSIWIWP